MLPGSVKLVPLLPTTFYCRLKARQSITFAIHHTIMEQNQNFANRDSKYCLHSLQKPKLTQNS